MSLLNSPFNNESLSRLLQNDRPRFRRVVDDLTKRTDGPTTNNEAGQPKRARYSDVSQDSDYGSLRSSQSQRQSGTRGTSGTIIKLQLINFMCHENLEVSLNQKINCIIGRNGSGKSAILTALVVALGGSANTTGRGTALKDFIMKGQQTAEVILYVNNSGVVAYKRDLYGDQIIIRRTLTHTGGSIKLCSSRNKIVSKRMEDLRNMTLTLGIQVDNPISVLDQNTSRQFLKQSKPEKKYELFMRATNLETLQQRYGQIQSQLNKIQLEIRNKDKQLQENEREVKEAKQKYDMFENLEKDRLRKGTLQLEHLWAMAREERTKLEAKESELEKVQGTLHHLEQLTSSGKVEEGLLQKIEAINADLNALHDQERENEDQGKEIKKSMHALMEQYKRCQAEEKKVQDIIRSEEEDIKLYEAEIDRQQQKLSPDYIELRRKQREKVEMLQDDLQKNDSLMKRKESLISQKQSEVSACSESVNEISHRQRVLEKELTNSKRELHDLKTHTSNLAVYGAYMPDLVQRIEAAYQRGQFSKKPIGPLGVFIKVRDPQWALAIESCCPNLSGFLVDNTADSKKLFAIINQLIRPGAPRPSVSTSRFLDKVHDVRQRAVQCQEYSNVLDMLDVSHPVVANALIDLCSVESILLIPTDSECQRLLSEERRVPRYCNRAHTLKGDRYHPAPQYRFYSGNARSARFLQTSREDIIQQLENRILDLEKAIQEEQNQLQELSKQESLQKREVLQLRNEYKAMQEVKLNLTRELEQLRDQEQPDHNTVSSLRKELDEKLEKLNSTKQSAEEYPAKLKAVKDKFDGRKEEFKALQDRSAAINAGQNPLRKNLQKCKEELAEFKSSQNHKKRKLEQCKKKEDECLNEQAQLKQSLKVANEKAQKLEEYFRRECEENSKEFISPSDTQRSPEVIHRELKIIEQKLEKVQRVIGESEDQIRQDYLDKHSGYTKIKEYLVALQGNAKELASALKRRQEYYLTQKVFHSAVVSHQFTRVLRYRNFSGSLEFIPERKLLNIKVGPIDEGGQAGLGTESLSGGERSYATTAFVIALWNVTELPFYFMDEFDVFMDKVNRDLVFSLLLRFAKDKSNYQFGFLTPCDATMIQPEDDITVFKLDDPKRS